MVLSLIYYDYPSSPRTLVVGVGRAVRGEHLESLFVKAGVVSGEARSVSAEPLLGCTARGRDRPENFQ
jgi:hypothetical protein